MSVPQVHAILGSVILAVGFWLMWSSGPILAAVGIGIGAWGMLRWRATSVGAVWAWTTQFLGLECLAWPLISMVALRMTTTEPTEDQMGQVLSAVVMGLFSGVFWLTFSYGLFKRLKAQETLASQASSSVPPSSQSKRKSR